jgi:hypothetical protein
VLEESVAAHRWCNHLAAFEPGVVRSNKDVVSVNHGVGVASMVPSLQESYLASCRAVAPTVSRAYGSR